MKDFNKTTEILTSYVGEVDEASANTAITKALFNSSIFEINDGAVVLDIFSSKHNYYEFIPREIKMRFNSLDSIQSTKYKGDERVFQMNDKNVNNIAVHDNTCDIIFAPAQGIGYGYTYGSILEIERVIKSGGLLIVDASRYWYQKQFNQLLFCSRNWELIKTLEVNYKFSSNPNTTAKYFLVYTLSKNN